MLDLIDDFLLSKMQKFTDWIQRVFGIVKFDIHKWVVILGSVSYWMFALALFDPVLLLISLLVSFLSVIKVWLLELDKRNWLAGKQAIRYSGVDKDLKRKSILVISGGIFFLVCISLLFLPSVAGFWIGVWCLLGLIDTYLGACTPKPPGKSKTRELYEKFLIKLNNALEPMPASVPVRR